MIESSWKKTVTLSLLVLGLASCKSEPEQAPTPAPKVVYYEDKLDLGAPELHVDGEIRTVTGPISASTHLSLSLFKNAPEGTQIVVESDCTLGDNHLLYKWQGNIRPEWQLADFLSARELWSLQVKGDTLTCQLKFLGTNPIGSTHSFQVPNLVVTALNESPNLILGGTSSSSQTQVPQLILESRFPMLYLPRESLLNSSTELLCQHDQVRVSTSSDTDLMLFPLLQRMIATADVTDYDCLLVSQGAQTLFSAPFRLRRSPPQIEISHEEQRLNRQNALFPDHQEFISMRVTNPTDRTMQIVTDRYDQTPVDFTPVYISVGQNAPGTMMIGNPWTQGLELAISGAKSTKRFGHYWVIEIPPDGTVEFVSYFETRFVCPGQIPSDGSFIYGIWTESTPPLRVFFTYDFEALTGLGKMASVEQLKQVGVLPESIHYNRLSNKAQEWLRWPGASGLDGLNSIYQSYQQVPTRVLPFANVCRQIR